MKGQSSRLQKGAICRECGELFIISAGEQRFLRKHNLSDPKRCKACRKLSKNESKEKDNRYAGLQFMVPGLQKNHIIGGIVVEDANGVKYGICF